MASQKRVLSALLCALLVLSATACGGGETAETTGTNPSTADTTTAESSTEETVLLPDKDFDGAEVMFLTALNSDYDWYSSYEIFAEEMNGGLINDAVFTRNQTIEDLLNI